MKKKGRAFSLVELMFFMLIVSIALAAFMPVISRKISADSPATRIEGAVKYNCQQYGEYCAVCYKKGCLLCEIECPSGRRKNPDLCRCE